MAKHNLSGWRRQQHDPRDFHLRAPARLVSALPATVDLSPRFGPQLNQGNLGACGPNTADEIIEYDLKAETRPVVSASRLFIYYNTRVIMGVQYVNQDSGVDNRSMMKALATYGYCDETLCPYADDDTTFTRKPSAAAYAAALPNKISSYAAVGQNLSQMQGVLASAFGFIFGFSVYQQMMSDEAAATGIIANPSGSSIGGHDVSFLGFTTVDAPGVKPGNKWPAGTFKFRNHWLNSDGSPWGDGGYGYIPFAYAISAQQAGDFWTINSLPGFTPTPPPVPPVPPSPPAPPVPPVPPVPPAPPSPPSPPTPPSAITLAAGTYTLPGGASLVIPKS